MGTVSTFLPDINYPDLQFDAVLSRTNVAPRVSRKHGAFLVLVQLFQSPEDDVSEQVPVRPTLRRRDAPFRCCCGSNTTFSSFECFIGGAMAEADCVWGCTVQMETVSSCAALVLHFPSDCATFIWSSDRRWGSESFSAASLVSGEPSIYSRHYGHTANSTKVRRDFSTSCSSNSTSAVEQPARDGKWCVLCLFSFTSQNIRPRRRTSCVHTALCWHPAARRPRSCVQSVSRPS